MRQLDEDTAGCARVNERDQVTARADTRFLVDKADTRCSEPRECFMNVRDLVAHVVQTGSALVEKPPDGCVGADRFEKLDTRFAHGKHCDVDPLVVDRFPMSNLETHGVAIKRKRVVNTPDSYPEMVDLHKPRSITELEAVEPAWPVTRRRRLRYAL